MLNIFKQWRENKKVMEAREEEEVRLDRLKKVEKAERDCVESNERMTHKPCPFLNNEFCSSACVHFQRAYHWEYDCEGWYFADWKPAKCKLWGKK